MLLSPKLRRAKTRTSSSAGAILQAARELFVSDAVERTTLDAVALRAKVSKRTVYDYYGDKRNLVLAVPVPRTAADHFIALSFGLVHNTQGTLGGAPASGAQQTIIEGVQAFLRAYAPR